MSWQLIGSITRNSITRCYYFQCFVYVLTAFLFYAYTGKYILNWHHIKLYQNGTYSQVMPHHVLWTYVITLYERITINFLLIPSKNKTKSTQCILSAVYLPTYLSLHLYVYKLIYLSIIYIPLYLLCFCVAIFLCTLSCTRSFIYFSIYLSMIYLCKSLSLHLST